MSDGSYCNAPFVENVRIALKTSEENIFKNCHKRDL